MFFGVVYRWGINIFSVDRNLINLDSFLVFTPNKRDDFRVFSQLRTLDRADFSEYPAFIAASFDIPDISATANFRFCAVNMFTPSRGIFSVREEAAVSSAIEVYTQTYPRC
jgi:hypothetical protein